MYMIATVEIRSLELILCWLASLDETASRQKNHRPLLASSGSIVPGVMEYNIATNPGAPCNRQLFFGSVNLNAFAQIYEESALISECTTVFTHVGPVAYLNFAISHISRMQFGIDECSAVYFR